MKLTMKNSNRQISRVNEGILPHQPKVQLRCAPIRFALIGVARAFKLINDYFAFSPVDHSQEEKAPKYGRKEVTVEKMTKSVMKVTMV